MCVDACASVHVCVREVVSFNHNTKNRTSTAYIAFFFFFKGAEVLQYFLFRDFDFKCRKMSLLFQSTCRYSVCSYSGDFHE